MMIMSLRFANSMGFDSNLVLMREMWPLTSERIGAKLLGSRKSVKEISYHKYVMLLFIYTLNEIFCKHNVISVEYIYQIL